MFTKLMTVQMHKAIGVMVVALFFGAMLGAADAKAATLAELQTLISSLTEQLNTLQSNSGSTGGMSKPSATSSTIPCSVFSRNLTLGAQDVTTGGDVTRLQNFLSQSGHFTYGKPTGYYGEATAAAVKRWQAEQGIVSSGTPATTGYGAFGPTTRAKMSAVCTANGGTATSPVVAPRTFTVSKTDLRAVVKFTLPNSCAGYVIDWGDGNTTTRDAAPAGTQCTQAVQEVTQARTYRAAGTYTITLDRYSSANTKIDTSSKIVSVSKSTETCLSGGVAYPEGTKRNQITLSNGTIRNIIDATFVCRGGEWDVVGSLPPATGTFITSVSGLRTVAEFTLPNSCAGYSISWGDGNKTTRAAAPAGTACTQAVVNVAQARTYAKAGTYTITLERYSSGTTLIDSSSKTVTVSSTVTPTTSCMNGGISYPEGTKRTSIDGVPFMADIGYVCEDGKWKSQNGLLIGDPDVPAKPPTFCFIDQLPYPEGTTRTGVIQPGGTWLPIADISSVCENGKWVSKNTYPLPPTPTPTPTPTTSCMNGGISYPEGTKRTSIDGVPFMADIGYVCENGEWKLDYGLVLPDVPSRPTTPTPSTSCLSGGVTYREGTERTSITNPDGTTRRISDGVFVCRNGQWVVEGGLPTPTPTGTPTFTSSVSGLTATLKFSIANGCAGYTLKWGDGIQTTRAAKPEGTLCTQAIINLEKPHTYARAGTYTVTLTRYAGTTVTDTYTKSITVGTVSNSTGYVQGATTTKLQETMKEIITTLEDLIAAYK